MAPVSSTQVVSDTKGAARAVVLQYQSSGKGQEDIPKFPKEAIEGDWREETKEVRGATSACNCSMETDEGPGVDVEEDSATRYHFGDFCRLSAGGAGVDVRKETRRCCRPRVASQTTKSGIAEHGAGRNLPRIF